MTKFGDLSVLQRDNHGRIINCVITFTAAVVAVVTAVSLAGLKAAGRRRPQGAFVRLPPITPIAGRTKAALTDEWPADISGDTSSIGHSSAVATSSLLAAARAGSATARDAVESITDELAQAIANISVVVSPELVVIGGPIGRTAGHIVAGCARRLTGRIPTVPRIVLGELRDAVLLGAAELAIDHVLSLNTLQLPPSGAAAT